MFLCYHTDCGCDHECTPGNGESFVCFCREDFILQSDGKTCGECKLKNGLLKKFAKALPQTIRMYVLLYR